MRIPKLSAQNLVWERSSFPFLMHCLGYTAQLCRGRVSLPVLNAAIYGIMRNLIEIVFLLCFQNLLVYGLALFGCVWFCLAVFALFALFALFSKFAPLTLANFEKGHFCLII